MDGFYTPQQKTGARPGDSLENMFSMFEGISQTYTVNSAETDKAILLKKLQNKRKTMRRSRS
jgi:hypothetical protein